MLFQLFIFFDCSIPFYTHSRQIQWNIDLKISKVIADWNMKIIGSGIYNSIYTNAMISYFLYSIFPGWMVMFLDSHRIVFTFCNWQNSIGVVPALWISILKIFKSLQNYWFRVTEITCSEKHFESSSGHTLSFCPNWWNIVSRVCFRRKFSSSLLRWSSLLRRIKSAANFVSSVRNLLNTFDVESVIQWSLREL